MYAYIWKLVINAYFPKATGITLKRTLVGVLEATVFIQGGLFNGRVATYLAMVSTRK